MIHLLQNGAQPKVPRYRPAVKFRKINKDTLEKLRNVDSLDDPNGQSANEEDETTDPSDDGNPNSVDAATTTPDSPPKPGAEFLIDSDIDIKSAALLDMISEDEVVSERPSNTQPTSTASSRPLTVDEALAMWD
jgi:hypothetical protein